MMHYLRMEDLDLHDKRMIIRVDLNVPMQHGKISNDARIRAVVPTLKRAMKASARVLVLSHLGRPEEGVYSEEFSLKPLVPILSLLLDQSVRFEKDWLDGVTIGPQQIVLAENVRFNVGEEKNDSTLAKRMAALCDVFIMDAFATSHRAQASTVGIAEFAPIAAAGPLLAAELEALSKATIATKHPLVAIVGGAKVSSKLQILSSLLDKVDCLILGGGIANTFLKAEGYSIGDSLYEADLLPMAAQLLEKAAHKKVQIILPIDVIVAKEISETASCRELDILAPEKFQKDTIKPQEKILDVGSQTSKLYHEVLSSAATILWNGPVGVFEYSPFSKGTESLSKSIAASNAFSIAGGGETLAAIEKFGVAENISYISTGGGAFLEFLEGKTLPAVAILEKRASEFQSVR